MSIRKLKLIIRTEGTLGIKKRIGARISILSYALSNFKSKLFSRDLTLHYGLNGRSNAGDTVLYVEVENIFSKLLYVNNWFSRNLHAGEIGEKEVEFINKRGKILILGGGGLLLADTNKNDNSGWQFNISVENLKKIKIPIAVFAIGYNKFRNQSEFIPAFTEHIATLVEKSVFFGLRNYGSIEAVKKYLPENLHDKVKLQPCPTNVLSYIKPKLTNDDSLSFKKVAICVALDRFELRFGNKGESIFNNILAFAENTSSKGWTVDFVVHLSSEMQNPLLDKIRSHGFKVVPLNISSVKSVLEYYSKTSLVIGMRGHSLMIPFGLNVPIISLTTHLKQIWFLETVNHPEWSIDVFSENIKDKLTHSFDQIVSNYSSVKDILKKEQKSLYDITVRNIETIKKGLKE